MEIIGEGPQPAANNPKLRGYTPYHTTPHRDSGIPHLNTVSMTEELWLLTNNTFYTKSHDNSGVKGT